MTAAKVAYLARATGRGFWEALEYLGYVEQRYGRGAARFELELPLAVSVAEDKAQQKKTRPHQ